MSSLASPAHGAEAGDEATFTAHVAQLLTRALPAGKAQIKGPLTLTIDGVERGVIQMNLDNLYSYCRRAPKDCDERTEAYVAQAAILFGKISAPLRRDDLRAVVRDSAYIEGAKKSFDLVAEPLIGDLWVLCMIDMPGAMQILGAAQLAELKLSAAEALTLCKKNVEANLRPLTPTKRDYPWPGVNVVTNDPYNSSWLIFPERWTAIAETVQGDLLVAVPGVDTLIYGSGAATDSVAMIGKAASALAAKAQKPLSTAVFRWTPTGWEKAKP